RLGDINDTFRPDSALEFMRPLPGLGQPSIVYTAFLDLHEDHIERYFLLKYEGHGAPAGDDGFITYGHEGLTTARKVVDKALLHIEFADKVID
ncbi:MAG: hypothetical protein GY826_44955, partial [Fuerstiella sp.]|nr:hypothetical protein [Fuerstiella sp.]